MLAKEEVEWLYSLQFIYKITVFARIKIKCHLPHCPKMGGYINSKLNHIIYLLKGLQISEKSNQPVVNTIVSFEKGNNETLKPVPNAKNEAPFIYLGRPRI